MVDTPLAEALPRTAAVIEEGRLVGLHTGAQLYASLNGQVMVDGAMGESRAGVPLTRETIMLWLSSGKPIAAVAIMQLVEQGLLALDDTVASHLPEFAASAKGAVTVRHLLTHTCGFRWVDVGGPGTPWDEIIARICRAKLERDWTPGLKAGYHPYTSWYVLGELVRRLSGQPFSDYVRAMIFEPLGMDDCWFGMSREQFEAYGDRIAPMPNTEKPGREPHPWSTPLGATHCAPGGSGHGPMRELARLYEMLLGGGRREGVRLLTAESVQDMTSRQRAGMFDETFKHVIDWGLGVILDSKQYGTATVPYGYGLHASPTTFGHSGSQSSAAFADPAHGLVVALDFNGMPGEARHQPRMHTALTTLYEDLGLATA